MLKLSSLEVSLLKDILNNKGDIYMCGETYDYGGVTDHRINFYAFDIEGKIDPSKTLYFLYQSDSTESVSTKTKIEAENDN